MTAPTPYPLAWPPGWPRTATREKAPYRTPLPTALGNLQRELALLCGGRAAQTLLLSSNQTLGASQPRDPGVVAYFTWNDEPMAIPCDRWPKVEHNVQAIALTLEAMRAMDRHGAKHMVKAMMRGFTALPAPTTDWRTALAQPQGGSLADAETAYRRAARAAHPDKPGGDAAFMAALNSAIEAARKELG